VAKLHSGTDDDVDDDNFVEKQTVKYDKPGEQVGSRKTSTSPGKHQTNSGINIYILVTHSEVKYNNVYRRINTSQRNTWCLSYNKK
jgi:hypothetical protein